LTSPAPQPLSRAALLGLALLAVLPFLNGLTGEFTYDDKVIVRDNARLSSPSTVSEIFTTHYFGGALTSGTAYRPVVLLTYAVQRWIHGTRVFWFHLVNVALHAAVTCLLAAWLVGLGLPRGPCVATAALFAVLTIHVEAVTGIVGRAEVLAALLVFLSARLWSRATEGERLRSLPYAGCLAAFTAGVFVKENAVVVPGVIALGELFRGGDGSGLFRKARDVVRRRWAAFAGLLLPVVLLFAVRRVVLKGFLISKEAGIFDLENPLVAQAPGLRIGNAAFLLWRYVAKAILPAGLSADHSAYALPLAASLHAPRAWLSLGGLAAAVALAVLLRVRRPLVSFGAALFAGTFLPTANLLFPIGTIYAERLLYLPSAGLILVAIGLLLPSRREVPAPSAWPWREALLVGAVLGNAAATVVRNRAFSDDATLYADMIRKMPRSAKAHYNRAFDLQRSGKKDEALQHLVTATEIFPRYYDAWALRGRLEWDRRAWDEAIRCYRRSVEIFGTYENGRWGLAKTLEESGHAAEAESAFRDGLKACPDSYPLAYHHAAFLSTAGRSAEAAPAWARAVVAGRGTALARLGRAKALSALGKEEPAVLEARRALVAQPTFVDARLFLATVYESEGKTLAAAGELLRAYRTDPSSAENARGLLELAVRRPECRGRAVVALPLIVSRLGARPRDAALAALVAAIRPR